MPSHRAPGRVNLIGDHTDYNDGFVLPAAIDLECVVRASPRDDGELRVRWLDGDDGVRYAEAVRTELAAVGRPDVGIDAEVTSTVPIGSGLSSSAALEVSLAVALCDAAGFELAPTELALACQRAEQRATGVPCGIMDQLSSVAGRAGHALLIDCRSLEIEPIPIPDELAIVVVHSGLPRALADSAYAERRAACERVAARLGLRALRDATPEQVADDPRARHVVSENARVLAASEALRANELERLGALMSASHASLRDDFEVSTPELDLLVTELGAAGAVGARLTGAGFGGCAVAVVTAEQAEHAAATIPARYRDTTGRPGTASVTVPSEGTHVHWSAGAAHQPRHSPR
jgi:galactokinase